MKTADSFYSKYEFPLRRDRSSGVYTKDDLLDFAEAFATERNQEIINMIDEMEEKSKEEEERMIAKLMKDKQMEDADGWRACYLYYRMALRGIRSKL